MQGVLPQVLELGANLVAVSPQKQELNLEVKEKHKIKYPILTDQDNQLAKQLNLGYSLSPQLQVLYKGFGIDLPGNHGTDSWEVPLATRLVLAKDGTIAAIDADPDYTIRPEPEATLEVLRSL